MFKYSIHKHHHHQLKPKDSLREPAASLKWCSISICERTFQIFNSLARRFALLMKLKKFLKINKKIHFSAETTAELTQWSY